MSKKHVNERVGQVKSTKKSRKKLIIGISSIVVFAGLLTWLVMVLINGMDSYDQVVTPDNIEEVISSLDEAEVTPIGSYEVLMNTTWNFESSEDASYDAVIGNSKYNQNEVYFTIELADTGEEIYQSPYIPVGSDLENIKLQEKLNKGTYECVLTYHLVDSNMSEVSTVSVTMTVIIQN